MQLEPVSPSHWAVCGPVVWCFSSNQDIINLIPTKVHLWYINFVWYFDPPPPPHSWTASLLCNSGSRLFLLTNTKLVCNFRIVTIVQHLVNLLCTSLWELNVQQIVPLHSRAVSHHSQQCAWCHNDFALRISVDLHDFIAHWNCFVNEIRVTRWSRAGYV